MSVWLFHSNSNSLRSKCNCIAANANAPSLIVQMDLSPPLSPAHAHNDTNFNNNSSMRRLFSLDNWESCNIFAIHVQITSHFSLKHFCVCLCWHRFEYTRPECVSESQTARYDRFVNFDGQSVAVCRLSDKNAFGLTLHFFVSSLLLFIHVFFAEILFPLLIHWCDHNRFSREPASLLLCVVSIFASIGVCFVHVRCFRSFSFLFAIVMVLSSFVSNVTHCDLHARPWYLSR